MKPKNILLLMLFSLILSTCTVIDPPSKLTEWRESRPYNPIIRQNADETTQQYKPVAIPNTASSFRR